MAGVGLELFANSHSEAGDCANAMSAVLYNFICASCGAEFQASGVPEMSYGEFVMRSELGEEVYLEAISSPAFDEVSRMVAAHPLLSSVSEGRVGDVIQKIFGVACDLSPLGHKFNIGMKPNCPNCSSREMASWKETSPRQQSQIPFATQVRWALMAESEKIDLLNQSIRRLLGCHDS